MLQRVYTRINKNKNKNEKPLQFDNDNILQHTFEIEIIDWWSTFVITIDFGLVMPVYKPVWPSQVFQGLQFLAVSGAID